MNDELSNKIKELAAILGQDTLPDNIIELLSLLAGSSGNGEGNAPKSPGEKTRSEDKDSQPNYDSDILNKIRAFLESSGQDKDPGLNLISAIKPFLSEKRRQRLDNCITILQMTKLSRYMDDLNKSAN